ncbi:multidrug transporter [Acidiplasma aeolicum]|jgi:MFS family permease|uniref:Multidrug transporter n=4 Tax=Ferroplasmaceae TaxID=90142 RepID=A0A0Q1B6E3_9ARCH|nr:multidrug transporter [Acidiplasma sp. MBA-1]KPV47065.1 multidrug transporter [Acidiplasma aeolicum]KQB35651.1 multidrug transporter [Acidiplasma cupricumulans]KQB35773.1 multidrug transporter [Acidiplasma aeolicum]
MGTMTYNIKTPSKRDINITIALMAFSGLLIIYVETMIVPAIPIFIKFFHSTYNNVSWILIAYIISGTVSAAIFGRVADMIGKKRVFLALGIVYLIAVSFGGFSRTLDELIAVRAVQGLGFGMIPIAFAIINDVVPKKELALAQGIMSATFAIGSGIGLVLGAYITEDLGWQYDFHTAIPVTAVLLILTYIYLKDYSKPHRERIDYIGVSLLAIPLITFIFALSEGQTYGWTSTLIISLFVFSFIMFFVFVYFESNYKYAFINMKLLKVRNVLMANIIGLFAMAAMYFLFFTVPTLLQDPAPAGFGKSIIDSGLIMFPATVMNMLFAPVAARVIRRKGPKLAIFIGLTVDLIGFILLYLYRSSLLEILLDTMFVGAGISMMLVGIINVLLISTPREHAGEATGINTVFRDIGMSIAPAVGGVLETMYTVPVVVGEVDVNGILVAIKHGFPDATAYNYIYLIGVVFVIFGFIFTAFIKKVKNTN